MAPPARGLNYESKGAHSSLAAQIMGGSIGGGGNRMARSMGQNTRNDSGSPEAASKSSSSRAMAGIINGKSSHMMGGQRATGNGSLMALSGNPGSSSSAFKEIANDDRGQPAKRAKRIPDSDESNASSPVKTIDFDQFKYRQNVSGSSSRAGSSFAQNAEHNNVARKRKPSSTDSDEDRGSSRLQPPAPKRKFKLGSRQSSSSRGSSPVEVAPPAPPPRQKATKAQRLNALFPGFKLATVERILKESGDQASATLDKLRNIELREKMPEVDSLSSKQQQILRRLVDEFSDMKRAEEKIIQALVKRDWDEEETRDHLDMINQVATTASYQPRVKVLRKPTPPRADREGSAKPKAFPVATLSSDPVDDLDAEVIDLTAANTPKSGSKSAAAAPSAGDEEESEQRRDRRMKPAEESDASDADSVEAEDKEEKQAVAALKWFNTSDKLALMDTINCNDAQANTLMGMRPFKSVDDVLERLGDRKAKGVTPKLFTNCIELMAGYSEVDEVLEKCERIGKKLMGQMAAWNLESAHTAASTRENTPVPGEDTPSGSSAPPSGSATPSGSSAKDKKPLDLRVAALAKDNVRKAGYIDTQPENMATNFELKDYQIIGVNWLNMLYNNKTSCILADEMGLGKTVQVIAFLATLKMRREQGPHLIVVPSSVLENWKREFKMFAPVINVAVYWGPQKEREQLRYDFAGDDSIDVFLTTYDMASAGGSSGHLDAKFFKKRNFNVCVFDEGHMLKNRKSDRYQKLMRVPAKWRLLLTGTPLQNNLTELVSLLNFIMPGYFREADEALDAIFKIKAGTSQKNLLSQQRVLRAKKMMQPFVLRRKKDKVLRDLSSKQEIVEWCDMTPEQSKIYKDVWEKTKAAVQEGEKSSKGVSKTGRMQTGKATSSNVLMDLRKAANHPLLFRTLYDDAKISAMAKDYVKNPDFADEPLQHVREDFKINSDAQLSMTANSYVYTRKHVLPDEAWLKAGKIQALQRLLPKIKEQGDRVLIFSQFTTVLDILTIALDAMGVSWVGFTGATKVEDRQILVDQFTNDPSITVFLLSTKAGGLGINLTAANWVILYDQDFNPQNDKQAMDRSYRLGQKKDVTVVRLICKGTIDQSIYELGTRKLELANRVSDGQTEDIEDADDTVQQEVATGIMAGLRDMDAAKGAEG